MQIFLHFYGNPICQRSYFFPQTYIQKESGTAILPFHSSRLWYCLLYQNSNTVAHAVCILYNKVHATRVRIYTYHRHLSAAMFWILRIYQIQMSQNKARKTLFIMSVSHHTYWTLPRRGLYKKCTNPRSAITEYAAKLLQKFDICKYFFEKMHFLLFFL